MWYNGSNVCIYLKTKQNECGPEWMLLPFDKVSEVIDRDGRNHHTVTGKDLVDYCCTVVLQEQRTIGCRTAVWTTHPCLSDTCALSIDLSFWRTYQSISYRWNRVHLIHRKTSTHVSITVHCMSGYVITAGGGIRPWNRLTFTRPWDQMDYQDATP
jgi:hypothetical protein